jgi:hypothetical protein
MVSFHTFATGSDPSNADVLQPLLDQARTVITEPQLYDIPFAMIQKRYPQIGADYRSESIMPDILDTLTADGTIELLTSKPGYREYHIPKLRHCEMTWMGWQTITYILVVDDEADPSIRYTISTDSDHSGGDLLFNTDDPDELESWIQDRAEQRND